MSIIGSSAVVAASSAAFGFSLISAGRDSGDRVGCVGVSEASRDSFEGKRPSPWNLELRHNGFLERTKTAMGNLAESVREQPAMPRFEDGR